MFRPFSGVRKIGPLMLWDRLTRPARLRSAGRTADAFLVSYPKSGRTWLRYILSHYFNMVGKLGADVDLHSMFAILPNYALDRERGIPGFRYSGSMPLIAVSHLDYERRLFGETPIIFLVRDPRDVLVSSYFHATRHKHRYSGAIEDFLDSEQGLPALTSYLNGWAQGLTGHRYLSITYEALARGAVPTVAELLRFLGCNVDTEILAEAARRSDFDAMRRGERQTGIPGHDYDRLDDEALRMRRGKVGGYRDYLSADTVRHVENQLALALTPDAKSLVKQTGLILPGQSDYGADQGAGHGAEHSAEGMRQASAAMRGQRMERRTSC